MRPVLLLASGFAVLMSVSFPLHAAVAYLIPAGTVGTQNFNGALGMDFDVVNPGGISVTRLGAFDSGSDGINGTIEVGIFDRNTQSLVGTSVSFTGAAGVLEGGSRFLTLLTPIDLVGGFQGTIVAQGYNALEFNGNFGTGSVVGTTDDGGGLITFVGDSRFGPAGTFGYPGSVDGGPANRYHGGTFDYVAIPEPGVIALLLGAACLLGFRQRRVS